MIRGSVMKERKQKTLAKRLLVAMLSVMMTVTFIPTSLFAYAAEPEVAPDDVQNEVQTEVVQDDVQQEDVQEEVKTEEPQTEATKPAKQEATKAKDESKSDKADAADPEYTKDLDEVFVRVTTDEDAFAEKVKLVVEPLEEESDAFKDAEKALAKSKQTYSGILAYDIHFESVETGKEIEPDGTVSVEMQAKAEGLKDIAVDEFNAASVQMSHIVGKKAEVVADTYDKKQTGIEGTVEVDKTKKDRYFVTTTPFSIRSPRQSEAALAICQAALPAATSSTRPGNSRPARARCTALSGCTAAMASRMISSAWAFKT